MRRRDFIKALGGTSVAWLPSAHAQHPNKNPRVGVLWHAGSAQEEAIYLGALQQGLEGLGYVDGKTITLEHRFPNEKPERFVSLANELAVLRPDVLVTVTQQATVAAKHATATIPIVFVAVPDPVGVKLIDSLSHPGGNITGLTHIAAELSGKRLSLFKEAFPQMTRVALLVNANNHEMTTRYIDETKAAATAMGLDVRPVEVGSLADLNDAFDKIVTGRLEGVTVPAEPLFYQGRSLVAQAANMRRLPLMVHSRELLEAGALMSYGPDQRRIFRRAAVYVDKILKGEKPADLPVEQPTKFELLINNKTARAIGFTIPESLLLRADEVIE
jgi:putative ABC transport system substrate-binding protein